MKVNTLSAWSNYIVKIQRRPTGSVNVLGEPNLGDPTTWSVIPDPRGNLTHRVRIEFNVESMEFTPTGERVIEHETLMFASALDYLRPEDRVTIVGMNNVAANINPNLNNYFIIHTVIPENDSVGNISHWVCELQTV